jgi:hypothetical protein
MTQMDVALLLAMLGAVCVLSAWQGRRTGDTGRDTALMAVVGAGKLALAATLPFA